MNEREEHEQEHQPPEEESGIGAPEDSPSADQVPALPSDDDAPLGDTDQHSDA